MRRHTERIGKRADIEQRDVVLAAFHAADITAVKFGFIGERFLRQTNFFAKLAQPFAKPYLGIELAFHRAIGWSIDVYMSTGYNYQKMKMTRQ